MNNRIKLSISIVVYKPNLDILIMTLQRLHQALLFSENVSAHLFVVDNSISEEWGDKIKKCLQENFSLSEFIQAEVITNSYNNGYGAGNNLAIEKANSDYHLVMNPDVYVAQNAIFEAIKYMQDHPETGLLTPAVYGEEGERHYLCKKNPKLLHMFLRSAAPTAIKKLFHAYLARYEMRNHDYDNVIDNVEFPTGCFMFFRTELLKKIKGFDPQFFMYYEDADIGRRMAKIAKIEYVPQVKITHKWSRGTHNDSRLKWITVQSGFKYWRKWGGCC